MPKTRIRICLRWPPCDLLVAEEEPQSFAWRRTARNWSPAASRGLLSHQRTSILCTPESLAFVFSGCQQSSNQSPRIVLIAKSFGFASSREIVLQFFVFKGGAGRHFTPAKAPTTPRSDADHVHEQNWLLVALTILIDSSGCDISRHRILFVGRQSVCVGILKGCGAWGGGGWAGGKDGFLKLLKVV